MIEMKKIYLIFFIIIITALSGVLGAFAYVWLIPADPADVSDPYIARIDSHHVIALYHAGVFEYESLSDTSYAINCISSGTYGYPRASSVFLYIKTSISFNPEQIQIQFKITRKAASTRHAFRVIISDPIKIYDNVPALNTWINIPDSHDGAGTIDQIRLDLIFNYFDPTGDQIVFHIRAIPKEEPVDDPDNPFDPYTLKINSHSSIALQGTFLSKGISDTSYGVTNVKGWQTWTGDWAKAELYLNTEIIFNPEQYKIQFRLRRLNSDKRTSCLVIVELYNNAPIFDSWITIPEDGDGRITRFRLELIFSVVGEQIILDIRIVQK